MLLLRTVDDCLANRSQLGRTLAPGGRRAASSRGGRWTFTLGLDTGCLRGRACIAASRHSAKRWPPAGPTSPGTWRRPSTRGDTSRHSSATAMWKAFDSTTVRKSRLTRPHRPWREPATGWLQGSGLAVDEGLLCDATGAAEAATGVVARRRRRALVAPALRAPSSHRALGPGFAPRRYSRATLLAGPDNAHLQRAALLLVRPIRREASTGRRPNGLRQRRGHRGQRSRQTVQCGSHTGRADEQSRCSARSPAERMTTAALSPTSLGVPLPDFTPGSLDEVSEARALDHIDRRRSPG